MSGRRYYDHPDTMSVAKKLQIKPDQTAAILRAPDGGAWVAYPKAGQLDTDLNRDVLAGLLRARGVAPVRQIAIDDVWSALRVRPA